MAKPLRASDLIRLVGPAYGEPDGPCVVIADQSGPYVWFVSQSGGFAFVAQRTMVRLIKRGKPS